MQTVIELQREKVNADYRQYFPIWVQDQIDNGIPKHKICQIAVENFGNNNPLSDRTIRRYFSDEYKDAHQQKNAKKQQKKTTEQKLFSKLKNLPFKSAKSILDMAEGSYESAVFLKNNLG